MGKVTMESIVEAVNDLPALPDVVVEIMELTENPDSTAQDINNVLNRDQSLTAKVLKLANSAFYGFPRRISTVTDATVLLGFKTIRGIIMAAAVSGFLNQEVEGYALGYGELWRHSQCAAMTARLIAKKAKVGTPDLAYTAAIIIPEAKSKSQMIFSKTIPPELRFLLEGYDFGQKIRTVQRFR